jgi:hypothetical protein
MTGMRVRYWDLLRVQFTNAEGLSVYELVVGYFSVGVVDGRAYRSVDPGVSRS